MCSNFTYSSSKRAESGEDKNETKVPTNKQNGTTAAEARQGSNEGARKRKEGASTRNRTAAKKKQGKAKQAPEKRRRWHTTGLLLDFFFDFRYIEYSSQLAQA